jgi:hypothetical protein
MAAGLGFQGDGGALEVGGLGAGRVLGVDGVLPAFRLLDSSQRRGEVILQAFLPGTVESGVDGEPAVAIVRQLEDGLEFLLDRFEGIGALGDTLLLGDEDDRDGFDPLDPGGIEQFHRFHPGEHLGLFAPGLRQDCGRARRCGGRG